MTKNTLIRLSALTAIFIAAAVLVETAAQSNDSVKVHYIKYSNGKKAADTTLTAVAGLLLLLSGLTVFIAGLFRALRQQVKS